jgi:hypothetical protein
MEGRDPVAEYRSARRLARELGMPRDAVPMHAPPKTWDAYGARWAGWHVEMFGELVTDGPAIYDPAPMDGSVPWTGYQGGPGPMTDERLTEIWGDSLPADERARMIAGRPALSVRAWQIIYRRAGIAAHIEARRTRAGTWDVSIRNLGPKPKAQDVRDLLPGLGLIRRQITREGGRPPGSGKRPGEVLATVARWRKAKGEPSGYPPAYVLGQMLRPRVEAETARKYLRQMRTEEAKRAGK